MTFQPTPPKPKTDAKATAPKHKRKPKSSPSKRRRPKPKTRKPNGTLPPPQHFPTSKDGTYAEFVSAPAACLVRIPEGTPFEAAAAAPLAALTAWQALAPRMPLEGRRVLVHAGAGGVGSFVIQVGRAGAGRARAPLPPPLPSRPFRPPLPLAPPFAPSFCPAPLSA